MKYIGKDIIIGKPFDIYSQLSPFETRFLKFLISTHFSENFCEYLIYKAASASITTRNTVY